MKKIKTLVTSSIVIMAIILSPLVSFADNGKNSDKNIEVRAKQHVNINSSKDSKKGFFSNILNFFGKDRAKIAVAADINTAPSISGITSPTVLKVGQSGTWKIKASDPNNGNLSYSVDWGDNAENPFAKMAPQSFVQTTEFTHTYAKSGDYNIMFTVSNEAGKTATSKVTVHVTGSSVAAPTISNVSVKSIKKNQATIVWSTNVRSSSLVWYSTQSPVDTSGNPNNKSGFFYNRELNHGIKLNKLQPNTKYYVVVGSVNAGGKTLSEEISFTTLPDKNSDTPVITSLDGSKTVTAGQNETVTVKAYDPKNGNLSYSVDWGDNISIMSLMRAEPFVQTAEFNHIYTNPGTYTATFTVQNDAGKKASSSMDITVKSANPDTTLPIIAAHENITVEATSSAGAIVTYTSPEVTDNSDPKSLASCLPVSGSMFAMGDTKVLCDATDSSGNKAMQTAFTVTVSDTVAPTISNIAVSTLSSKSTIYWTTDEATKSKVFYSSVSPVDMSSSNSTSVSDESMTKTHSIEIPNLSASTNYYFVIMSTDASGNSKSSTESSFMTTAL